MKVEGSMKQGYTTSSSISGNSKPFTFPRDDRILWILANDDSEMERSRLRVATGMRK